MFFEKLGIVKLTDFGFSNKFSPGQKLETSCGSLAYSAPEILLGDSYDAPAVGMSLRTMFHLKSKDLNEFSYWFVTLYCFSRCMVLGCNIIYVGMR